MMLFQSLAPVLAVILIGWGLRASEIIDAAGWAGFETLTYYLFFPALIIGALASADLSTVPFAATGLTLTSTIIVMAFILLVLRRPLQARAGLDGPTFCSVFQGVTRWNSFVALALAGNLFGPVGLTLASVAVVAMVPLLNVMAVGVHARYAAGTPLSPRRIVVALAKNPFIWACLIGALFNRTGVPIAAFTSPVIDILGKSALAAGLLGVGSGLDVKRLRIPSFALVFATLTRLIAMPLLGFALAILFGLTGSALAVVVISTAVPSASGSYIIARQLGGNAPLMAEIITVQTLFSMVTMPLMVILLIGL